MGSTVGAWGKSLVKVAGKSVFDVKLVERLIVSPVRFKPYKA